MPENLLADSALRGMGHFERLGHNHTEDIVTYRVDPD